MLKIPAYLTGFSSKVDGSASVRFATQEVSGEEFSIMKSLLNEFGWLVFMPNEFDDSVLPQEQATKEDFEKTPSQRLYNVLFVYFIEVKKGKKEEFPQFYKAQIEKFIEHIKSKLD